MDTCAHVSCGKPIRWDGTQWRHTETGDLLCRLKATPGGYGRERWPVPCPGYPRCTRDVSHNHWSDE